MFKRRKPRDIEILENAGIKISELNRLIDSASQFSAEEIANFRKQLEEAKKEVEHAKHLIIPDILKDDTIIQSVVTNKPVDRTDTAYVVYAPVDPAAVQKGSIFSPLHKYLPSGMQAASQPAYLSYESDQERALTSQKIKKEIENYKNKFDERLNNLKQSIAEETDRFKAANHGREELIHDKLIAQEALFQLIDHARFTSSFMSEESGLSLDQSKLDCEHSINNIQQKAKEYRDAILAKFTARNRYGIIADELKTKIGHLRDDLSQVMKLLDADAASEIIKIIDEIEKKKIEFQELLMIINQTDVLHYNSEYMSGLIRDKRVAVLNLISQADDKLKDYLLKAKLADAEQIEDPEFKKIVKEFLTKPLLPDQIDLACEIHIYQHSKPLSSQEQHYKEIADSLLKATLQAKDDQELRELMRHREEMKKINSSYLPKKNLMQLTLPGVGKLTGRVDIALGKKQYKLHQIIARAVAQSKGITLPISAQGLSADSGYSIKQFPEGLKLKDGKVINSPRLETNVLYMQRSANGYEYVVIDPQG